MIKHIRFMRRREGVSPDEHREAWLRHHAIPMAEKTRALRYYSVFFPSVDGVDQPFHQAVVLYYRDMEHWGRAYAGQRAPSDDAFTALGNRGAALLLVTREQSLIDGPDCLTTSSWYLRPAPEAPGTSLSADSWSGDVAPLSSTANPPVRLSTSVALEDRRTGPYVALTEVGWPTASARESGDASPAVRARFADAMRLLPADPVVVTPGYAATWS